MLTPGTLLGNRYHILRRIGGGGMGVVYLAQDQRLPGRQCAVKEMSLIQLAPQDRNWAIQAFRQEAQMLANLHHPGLAAVSDFFAESGNWYLVMDYVEGETLKARLERAPGGRLALDEALRITGELCDVLIYLHRQSPPVVFRDLKPSNVMLTPEGKVKLIDFGIARFFKPGQTRDTMNLGTPGYAAPEQYGGLGQSDRRADIYSLGVLLHQMVSGYDPGSGVTPFPLPPLETLAAGLPTNVRGVVARATAVQPDQRYQSIEAFKRDLFANPPGRSAPSPSTSTASPKIYLIIGGVGLLSFLIVAFLLLRFLLPLGAADTPTPPVTQPGETVTTERGAVDEGEPVDALTPTSSSPTATPRSLTDTPTPEIPSDVQRQEALLRTVRYREDNGTVVFAEKVSIPPTLDGVLDEWTSEPYAVSYVVYTQEGINWQGREDLFGTFQVAWDDAYLYLGVEVTDDVHVQAETGDQIYKGDEVEIQIDANLTGDFEDTGLSGDDGQVGLSPGDFERFAPEAYIWRPPSLEQPGTMIEVASRRTQRGYILEAAIPWWVLMGPPALESPVGFCLSLGDNDAPALAEQQLLLATSPNRKWGDPTTWGTLILVDWR